jgi:hypothetical protein
MAIPRALFPDGHDIYTDDLTFMQDTVEAQVQSRLKDITLAGGVASGLTPTPNVNDIDVSDGDAYTEADRAMVSLSGGPTTLAIVAGDVGKYLVLSNVATDGTSGTHPITGAAVNRRTTQVGTLSIAAAPTTDQVKLCSILTHGPVTVSTDAPNREVLQLGVGVSGGSVTNPYIVVALDGTGDYTTLAAAVAALPAGGGMIYVKAGVYNLTTKVDITISNVRIVGAGPFTVLTMDGSSDDRLLDIDGSITGIQIESLAFDWDTGDPGGGQNNCAIRVAGANNVSIRDCVFLDSLTTITTPIGVWLDDAATEVRVSRCATPSTNGIEVGVLGNPTTTANRCIVRDCTWIGVSYGVRALTGCDNWVVSGCILGSPSGTSAGVRTEDNVDWAINGNIFDGATNGIQVTGATSAGHCMTGNRITGCTTGVLISAGTKCVVDGNSLAGNGTAITDGGTLTVLGDNAT